MMTIPMTAPTKNPPPPNMTTSVKAGTVPIEIPWPMLPIKKYVAGAVTTPINAPTSPIHNIMYPHFLIGAPQEQTSVPAGEYL